MQWVDILDNNQLWERAHDPEAGLIVRVNNSHRFAREMIAAFEMAVAGRGVSEETG